MEYDTLTEEEYNAVSKRLSDAAEEIGIIIDLYLSIQEIINDLYIVALTAKNLPEKKSSIIATLKMIIANLRELFLTDASGEIPDELTGRLAITEGHQESLLAECNLLEAAYDEIASVHKEEIAAQGKTEIFASFPAIARLMSSSVFAELADEEASAPVTPESLSKAKDTMMEEYTGLFKQNKKTVNRAVMAAALSKMPVIFNTQQELTNYIGQSLAQCRNEIELKAVLNILDSIMLEG